MNGWQWIASDQAALEATTDSLRRGEIVAIKGLGGFHLVVDAANATAVARLRLRKARRSKPFALMVRDLEMVRRLCEVSEEEALLLESAESPIVLLRRRTTDEVALEVAPDQPALGVMLPYTPLHHLLLASFGGTLVATSGNLSDEPICTDETEALARLGHIADSFLMHDRPIARHVDDSVAIFQLGEARLLRRGARLSPALPIQAPYALPTILAVGAHQKNTVALERGAQCLRQPAYR